MSSRKNNIIIYASKVLIVTLLVVLFIRYFLIESYDVSSSQMEPALLKGDKIFIDKTAYGIRMPMTILSVPFTFDSFLGYQSYSTLWELPYKRLFTKKITRNDIILFNNPLELNKPLDKRGLLLSRCVGLPGDTIEIKDENYFINKKQYTFLPEKLEEYIYRENEKASIKTLLNELDLPIRNYRKQNDTIIIDQTRYERIILSQNIPDSLQIDSSEIDSIVRIYKFIVPYQGQQIEITKENINLYRQLIHYENEERQFIGNMGELLLDNKEIKYYKVKQDYYWVLSDNPEQSIDSRNIGFIPFRNVIGKGRLIWFSCDGSNIRTDRCLTNVK